MRTKKQIEKSLQEMQWKHNNICECKMWLNAYLMAKNNGITIQDKTEAIKEFQNKMRTYFELTTGLEYGQEVTLKDGKKGILTHGALYKEWGGNNQVTVDNANIPFEWVDIQLSKNRV